MMNTAFTVGVVLMAKDLYSGVLAKAQRDITQLGKVSQVQADAFSQSLAKWQRVGVIGLGVTAASYKVAGVFEDLVREAGSAEAAVGKAFIQMGGRGGLTRDQLARVFSGIQTTWGIASEQTSAALGQAGGRLDDYAKGLGVVQVAATLSTARQMDLATSTDIITTLYKQFGKTITSVSTDQDKFRLIASEVSSALKSSGGDAGELGTILGTFAIKAAGAGQSLETVLGLIAMLGASGAGPRYAAGLMDLFGKMSEMRLSSPEGFAAMYPTAAKTGDILDFLGDLKKRFATLGVTDANDQLALLHGVFEASDESVQFLLNNMDKLSGATDRMSAAGKDLTAVERQAEDQMGTWDGVQKRLTGRVHEFKEMLGTGALPVVKAFDKALGGALLTAGKSQGLDRLMSGFVAVVGLSAELGKVAGPVMTAVSALQLYNLNQRLAASLTATTTGTVQAQQLSMLGLKGGLTGVVGLMGEIAAIGGTFLLGWNIGRAIGELTGLDDALQKFLGHLFHGNVELTKGQEKTVEDVTAKLRAGKAASVSKEDMTTYLRYQREISKREENEGQFVRRMQRSGVPQGALVGAGFSLAPAAADSSKAGITAAVPNQFASGGPVGSTGLALVHEGEYVLPRSLVRKMGTVPRAERSGGLSPFSSASGSAPHVSIRIESISVQGSGHLDYDVRALAKAIIRILPGELKAQARRYA